VLNGLDLFSGIGGLSLALSEWVQPMAYCEIDRYAQGVLLSRMAENQLRKAPIWDDVRTLRGNTLPIIDIIYGGFPCQDISVAGNGAGLAGERSGLFFEIARLCSELRPAFVFLENVPAITSRGGREVVGTFAALGYDARWCVISAASVGANHKRERWFLLAHTHRQQHQNGASAERRQTAPDLLADTQGQQWRAGEEQAGDTGDHRHQPGNGGQNMADTAGAGWETWGGDSDGCDSPAGGIRHGESSGNGGGILEDVPHAEGQGLALCEGCGTRQSKLPGSQCGCWWAVEPAVGRMAHGVPHRVDRLTGLGNAVVPLQARTAFEILSGIRRPA
jgi:DNA (cytosine-5)-methyltransferase 1